MQAIVYRRYGSPDKLTVEDVPLPTLKDDAVLVRVKAVAINPFDWHLIRGIPYFVRFESGLRAPTRNIPGIDVAGVVEAVGSEVTEFRPGDEVFGEKSRSCAEFVAAPAATMARKPERLTFVEAAAIPVAGVTALQALRDKGRLEAGQHVLINGASGGIGTFAVQIAKSFGATVTGVCSTPNVELVRSLGADHVIDYTRDDFTASGVRYDLIVDNVGNRSLGALRRALTPTGTLVMVGAPTGRLILGTILKLVLARVLGRFTRQRLLGHLTQVRRADLELLSGLAETGAVVPVIDRCYPLAATGEAIAYLETLRARGKVVITP